MLPDNDTLTTLYREHVAGLERMGGAVCVRVRRGEVEMHAHGLQKMNVATGRHCDNLHK